VDVERFDRRQVDGTSLRRELGIPAHAPVVGTVAVFRVQKRLDHWLEAARTLKDTHPDAHFLMVGDGPLRQELEDRAAALGLAGAVHWVGLQAEVRPYLAAMDVYLMSSTFEGLPIALLEAMSMECAVVSTAVGGIPELVADGENGFLVQPERPELLARTVSRVLASPALLRESGAAARRTVAERFSIRRMTEQLEEAYLTVVERYRRVG
jgi:glycosyltransferase involved in cell wall biosynthesis